MAAQEVTLTSPGEGLCATFLPGLGMVCSSLSHRGEELLARRGGAEANADAGSTLAIAILHPWADRLSAWEYSFDGQTVRLDRDSPVAQEDERGLPVHGVLAACRDWTLTDVTETALEARLDYSADPLRAAAFPFPHALIYSAAVSDTGLAIALEMHPTGDVRVPIAFGFHPHLTLPGSDRRSWTVVDDLQGDPPVFSVEDDRRRLSVALCAGYPVAQVFAPPGSDFICFQLMTAPADALCTGVRLPSVAPGESFDAIFAISVSTL